MSESKYDGKPSPRRPSDRSFSVAGPDPKKHNEIQHLIRVFCEGAWTRVVYYGLDPFFQDAAANPTLQPEILDKHVISLSALVNALDATLPQSSDLSPLVVKGRQLGAMGGDTEGDQSVVVECLEILVDLLSATASSDNMVCTCVKHNSGTNKQKVFVPSGSFGMSGNISANTSTPTCKILIAQALLYLEAPDVLLFLLINWSMEGEGEALRGAAFEWILKILGILDLLFLRNALFSCEGAITKGLSSKRAWWQGGGFAKSLTLLENPPLGIFVACAELMTGVVQTTKDRNASYVPLRALSRLRNPEFFPSTCRAMQRADFSILKPFLEHLIQSLSRMENIIALLGDVLWPTYFAPLLLVGGAHAWPNMRFHRASPKEAQAEVEIVIKLTISICVTLLHAGFVGYKEVEDNHSGSKTPKLLTRSTSNRHLNSSVRNLNNTPSGSPRLSPEKNKRSKRNFSFDMSGGMGAGEEGNVTPTNADKLSFSRLLLSLLNSIENISMWTPDTVVLTRAILSSLIFKLMPSLASFRQDTTSVAWEHVFQLSLVVENFVFYCPILSTPMRAIGDRNFTHPGLHDCDDLALVNLMIDLLAGLKISALSSDMFEDVESKTQCKYVTKRTTEEQEFWGIACGFLLVSSIVDEKKPLAKTKEYRSLETALRNRRTKYRQMKSNAHPETLISHRSVIHKAAPPVPNLETKNFSESDLHSQSIKPFSSKQAEKSFWKKKKDLITKDKNTKERRQKLREKIEEDRGSTEDEKHLEGWWARRNTTHGEKGGGTLGKNFLAKLSSLTSRTPSAEVIQQAKELSQLRGDHLMSASLSSSRTKSSLSSTAVLAIGITPASRTNSTKNSATSVLTVEPLLPRTVDILNEIATDFKDEMCSKVDSDDEEDPLLWAEARPRSVLHSEPPPPNSSPPSYNSSIASSPSCCSSSSSSTMTDDKICIGTIVVTPVSCAQTDESKTSSELDFLPRKSEILCTKCCKEATDEGFFEVNNSPHCAACWRESLLCALCRKPFAKGELYARASFPDGLGSSVLVEQLFHKNCFVCTEDKQTLPQAANGSYPDVRFREKQLFCLTHYNDKYGVRCGHCSMMIEKTVIYCLERAWHPGHLFCANSKHFKNECKNQLDEQKLNIPSTKEWEHMILRKHPVTSASLRTQVGFCQTCYDRDVQDVCRGCGKLFHLNEETALVADGEMFASFHFACVKCVVCTTQTREQMDGEGASLSPEGVLFCAAHYQAQQGGTLPPFCSRCHKAINGKVVSVNSSRYHTECLQCSACAVVLDPELFADSKNSAMLCSKHATNQLAGSACASCFEPLISGTVFQLDGSNFHDSCLVCWECKVQLGSADDRQIRVSPSTAVEHLQKRFWCATHFALQFSTKCVACGEGILGTVVVFRDLPRHQGCICCHVCKVVLTSATIAEKDGRLYCFSHFQLDSKPIVSLSLSLSDENSHTSPIRVSPSHAPPRRPPPASHQRKTQAEELIQAKGDTQIETQDTNGFRKPTLANIYFAPLDPAVLSSAGPPKATNLQISISPVATESHTSPNPPSDAVSQPSPARTSQVSVGGNDPPKRAPPSRPPPKTPTKDSL